MQETRLLLPLHRMHPLCEGLRVKKKTTKKPHLDSSHYLCCGIFTGKHTLIFSVPDGKKTQYKKSMFDKKKKSNFSHHIGRVSWKAITAQFTFK